MNVESIEGNDFCDNCGLPRRLCVCNIRTGPAILIEREEGELAAYRSLGTYENIVKEIGFLVFEKTRLEKRIEALEADLEMWKRRGVEECCRNANMDDVNDLKETNRIFSRCLHRAATEYWKGHPGGTFPDGAVALACLVDDREKLSVENRVLREALTVALLSLTDEQAGAVTEILDRAGVVRGRAE